MFKYLLALCFVGLMALPASAQCRGRSCQLRSTTYYSQPSVTYSAPRTVWVKRCSNGRCYYVRQTVGGTYQATNQTVQRTTVQRPVLGTTVTRDRVVGQTVTGPVVQSVTVKSTPTVSLASLVNL